MTKNLKKFVIVLCVIIVFSLGLSVILSRTLNNKDNIGSICDVKITDDNIILILNDDRNISAVVCDYNGNELYSARYPIETISDGQRIHNSYAGVMTSENDVFINIVSHYSSNADISEKKIMQCNFKTESMKQKWTLPDDYVCRIINGRLYYLSSDGDNILLNSYDDSSIVKSFDCSEVNADKWVITDNLDIISFSCSDGIYEFSDSSVRKIYPRDDLEVSLVNFCYDGDSIYFTDLLNGQNLKYNLSSGAYQSSMIYDEMKCSILNSENYDTIKYSNLKNISCISENDNFAAVYDEKNIVLFNNDNAVLLDNINFRNFQPVKFFKYFAVCFLIVLTAVLSFYLFYRKKGYISVLIKIGALSVIIIFTGLTVIRNSMTEALTNNFRQDIYSIMLADISSLEYDVKDSLAYNDSNIDILLDMSDFSDICTRNIKAGNKIAPVHYSLYTYNNADNSFLSSENIPADYIFSNSDIDLYMESINNNIPVLITQFMNYEDYYTLVYPVNYNSFDDEAKSAVILLSLEKYIPDSSVSSVVNEISIIMIAAFAVLVLIFIIVLGFMLRPIKILNRKIIDNTIKADKVNSNLVFKDEVKDIKNVFENMIENISEYQKKMFNDNETYYKFLPSEIFSIFGKDNISKFEAGDSRKVLFYNMYMNLENTDKDLLEKNYSDLMINSEHDRYITETFNMECIEISFKNKPEFVIEYMKKVIDKFPDIYAGISYGTSIMAIIGGNQRLQAIIVSEHKKIAQMLSEIGRKYKRNLIVSHSFLKAFHEYDKLFNIRCIGNIRINNEYIRIYDVIDISDNCEPLIHTKTDFENGIDCFLEKDFYNAGIYFSKVLKYNKNDDIAKEYLNMSEMYLSCPDNAETDILLKKEVDYFESAK